MAFWAHLRNKRICSNAFNLVRGYSRISLAITRSDSRHVWTRTTEGSSFFVYQSRSREIGARFYSMQGKAAKQTVADPKAPRLNAAITAPTVRLVTDDGHRIVSRQEALNRAAQLQLDLVEVSRLSDPPVCKIMDYYREKYNQKLKEKDRAKSKGENTLRNELKEVRFSMKIEQKDLQLKANTALKLMERGYRVKCMAMGKEEEDLSELLSRLLTLLADVTYVETGPRLEKTNAHAVLRHIKFGLPKKSGKKAVTTTVAKDNVDEEVMDEGGMALQDHVEDDDASDSEDANLVAHKEKLDKHPKEFVDHQHKPVPRPTDRDGRSYDDHLHKPVPRPTERDGRSYYNQPRKIVDPSAANTKHSHPPASDKSSDTKQGPKYSSFGIFSSSKPVNMNNQQPPSSKNDRREPGMVDSKINVPNERDNDRWGKFSKQSPGPNQQASSPQYADRYQQRPNPQSTDRYQQRPSPRSPSPYQQRPSTQSPPDRYQHGPGTESPGPYQQRLGPQSPDRYEQGPGPQSPGPYQQRPNPQSEGPYQQRPDPHSFRR